MFQSVEGVYRDGKIEWVEPAAEGAEGKVIVTFLAVGELNLADRGIDETQAALLRAKLSTFTEDWQSPEMDSYDAVQSGRCGAGFVS